MKLSKPLLALAGVAFATAAHGADYRGTLKLPRSGALAHNGLYSFTETSLGAFAPGLAGENGRKLTLGYKYSRYFSVESEFVDFGPAAGTVFATPAASPFRNSGFGVDTVATLPFRGFSFYGRLGAHRGETRTAFPSNAISLLGDPAGRGTRLRLGMGMRYDFTRAFGIHAELERYSPLGSPLASDAETDLFSVGVKWRF